MLKMLFDYKEPAYNFAEAKNLWPGFVGSYGSPEPDLLTDFRFYMDELGVYRVSLDKGALVLESMRPGIKYLLRQVDASDPYFYILEKPRKRAKANKNGRKSEIPQYVVFVPGKNGKAIAIRIGLNEYPLLEGEAKTKAYAKAILGQAMPEIF
jgi:hypothetical protein